MKIDYHHNFDWHHHTGKILITIGCVIALTGGLAKAVYGLVGIGVAVMGIVLRWKDG